ncbi:5-(carboxyamino)imidazole ribonucleotide mutase [Alistipes sp.]|uniref:5-(carboxyamino)imidazole ribonucleotide mutase n=1 Tax=Alistipes sp. TaxID=1872444 RepID=UPI003AEF6CCF
MKVGVIMGSRSDYEVMAEAVAALEEFGVEFEKRVVSAHRTPDLLVEYAKTARERGLGVIIAGAGGAAHLPGMVASMTTLPVVGVPVKSRALNGLDSLLSIVQMPAGVPVATTAINGARNAALIAVSILALQDGALAEKLEAFRARQTAEVLRSELG